MIGLKSHPLKKEASGTQHLADLRTEAYARYEKAGFPTRDREAWKYIDLEPVTNAALVGTATEKLLDVILDDIAPYLVKKDALRIVFVNGVYSRSLSSTGKASDGILLSPMEGAFRSSPREMSENLGKLADGGENTFVDINTFSFRDGIFLKVRENTEIKDAIEFLFLHTDDAPASLMTYPRILILMESGSKASIISTHAALGKKVTATNEVAEVFLGAGASLYYTNIHRADAPAIQFFTGFFSLEEKSVFKAFTFVEGEGITRSDMRVRIAGQDAEAHVNGLSLLSGKAQSFSHITAHHAAERGLSRQRFKNILTGETQSEFNSLVQVDHQAVKSDSKQLSQSLLLSEGALVHARPQLKIDIDDVVCAHGATVGQLRNEELFYLRTRGLSKKDARFMLTYGFAEEMLEVVEQPELRKMLKSRISKKLDDMVTL